MTMNASGRRTASKAPVKKGARPTTYPAGAAAGAKRRRGVSRGV
jgi:hypothetical protein